jgi:hypothetical protein
MNIKIVAQTLVCLLPEILDYIICAYNQAKACAPERIVVNIYLIALVI